MTSSRGLGSFEKENGYLYRNGVLVIIVNRATNRLSTRLVPPVPANDNASTCLSYRSVKTRHACRPRTGRPFREGRAENRNNFQQRKRIVTINARAGLRRGPRERRDGRSSRNVRNGETVRPGFVAETLLERRRTRSVNHGPPAPG